jgi:hypothetical protein
MSIVASDIADSMDDAMSAPHTAQEHLGSGAARGDVRPPVLNGGLVATDLRPAPFGCAGLANRGWIAQNPNAAPARDERESGSRQDDDSLAAVRFAHDRPPMWSTT